MDINPDYTVELGDLGKARIVGWGVMCATEPAMFDVDQYWRAHEHQLRTDGFLAPVIG